MGYSIGEVKIINDKKGYVALDDTGKRLLVSDDIEVDRTEDGKLRATFKNPEPQKPTFLDMVRDLCGKRFVADDSDCSIIIDKLELFKSCERQGDTYTLKGGGVTFTGTDRPDKLEMKGCKGTTVNLKGEDDTLEILNEDTSCEVSGNTINMGDGDDKVSIKGKFSTFKNNKIYLGKGRNSVEAEINSENDAGIKTRAEYLKKADKYYLQKSFVGTEIHAEEGKRGWLDKDTFKSNTFTANKLADEYMKKYRYLFGFNEDNVTKKEEPQWPEYKGPIPQKPASAETKKSELFGPRVEATTKSTEKEELERRLYWAAAGDWVTGGSAYIGLLGEIVNSWAKDNPQKK